MGSHVDVYDFQMQQIISGTTDQNGSTALFCERKPFLVIAKKDKDRNYLKVNDGSSLSLSSFDVTGSSPENGIKAFIYGERDVWRPGDSIFLSIFIKDMISDLPPGTLYSSSSLIRSNRRWITRFRKPAVQIFLYLPQRHRLMP